MYIAYQKLLHVVGAGAVHSASSLRDVAVFPQSRPHGHHQTRMIALAKISPWVRHGSITAITANIKPLNILFTETNKKTDAWSGDFDMHAPERLVGFNIRAALDQGFRFLLSDLHAVRLWRTYRASVSHYEVFLLDNVFQFCFTIIVYTVVGSAQRWQNYFHEDIA